MNIQKNATNHNKPDNSKGKMSFGTTESYLTSLNSFGKGKMRETVGQGKALKVTKKAGT